MGLELRHFVIERCALEVHNDAGVRNGIIGQMYRERRVSLRALETRVVGELTICVKPIPR